MVKLPPFRRGPCAIWVVKVHGMPVEGRDWTDRELNDLADKHGYGTDEYYGALGPVDGHRSATTYGPYTERQAKKVADFICEHEVVGSAVASPLFRYVPEAPVDAPTSVPAGVHGEAGEAQ